MNMHANTVGNTSNVILKDIYIIGNNINNKIYIGQALNAEERFISHCKGSYDNSLIDKAIQCYGKDNFWYEILEYQIPDYNEREKFWIKELNSLKPNGYNIMEGGNEPPTFYGIDHPLSKFNSLEEVENLKNDLRYTTLSLSDIAKKYNQSKKTVLRINQGINYEKIGEKYPIRESPNRNGTLTEEDVDEIIEILKYSYRQYEEIGRQYNVKGSTIKQINVGAIHKKDTENYPIRKYKNSGTPALTYEQVTEITNLLLKTNISCNQLAKMFDVKLNEIYLVNNGNSKRYKREGYEYPLRKHNPKM